MSSMTPKKFLKLSYAARVSAKSFIDSHREWLTTGELSSSLSPIIAKLDSGVILPTPCKLELERFLAMYIINSDSKKAERAIQESQDSLAKVTETPYTVEVYQEPGILALDKEGKGIVKKFEDAGQAYRYADARLFDCCSKTESYATITDTRVSFTEEVTRQQAIERLFKNKKSPVSRDVGKPSKPNWQMRTKNDRASFSKG